MKKTSDRNGFDGLVATARLTMLNGLMKGGIPDAISTIIHSGAQYGGDIARGGGDVGTKVDETDFNQLIRDQVVLAVEDLFGGIKVDRIVLAALNTGIAFGCQAIKRAEQERLNGVKDAEMETIIAAAKKVMASEGGKLSRPASDTIVDRLVQLSAEQNVYYLRRILVEENIPVFASDKFKAHVRMFTHVLIDA